MNTSAVDRLFTHPIERSKGALAYRRSRKWGRQCPLVALSGSSRAPRWKGTLPLCSAVGWFFTVAAIVTLALLLRQWRYAPLPGGANLGVGPGALRAVPVPLDPDDAFAPKNSRSLYDAHDTLLHDGITSSWTAREQGHGRDKRW